MEPILRWLAEVVAAIIQPIRYFSRPTHPASSDVTAEMRSEGVVEGAQAVVTVTEDAVARPTTVKSFASPITAGVMVDPDVNRAAHIVLDDQEIQRRRDLVRMLFNDFWSAAYEKPAGFVERLDQAEDYVNDRLAANGEAWRLDSKNSSDARVTAPGEYGRSALGTTRLGRSRPRRLAPGYRPVVDCVLARIAFAEAWCRAEQVTA